MIYRYCLQGLTVHLAYIKLSEYCHNHDLQTSCSSRVIRYHTPVTYHLLQFYSLGVY